MWQKLSVLIVFAFVLLVGGNVFDAKGEEGSFPQQELDPATISVAVQNQPSFFVAINTFGYVHAFDISAQPGLRRYQVNTTENGNLRLVEAAVADFTGDKICDVMAFDTDLNLHRFVAANNRSFSRELVLASALPSNFFINSKIGDTAVGDFNGDGHMDFAVSGAHCASPPCFEAGDSRLGKGLVQIFLNQGNGNFTRSTSPLDFAQFGERQYERIAGLGAADYDNNGSVDLFIQHYWNSANNPTYVAANNSGGVFGTPSQLFTNPHKGGTNALAVGDFDKDGILDLVVGQDNDEPAGRTWFYKGKSGGGFEFVGIAYNTSPTAAEGAGQGLADVYDFNGDGNLDIVAAAENLGVYLFLGNGNGTFQERMALYDADIAWFKISTPPLGSGSACFWNEEAASSRIHLPFLSR